MFCEIILRKVSKRDRSMMSRIFPWREYAQKHASSCKATFHGLFYAQGASQIDMPPLVRQREGVFARRVL
jgi:hypothetical protein